MRQIPLDPREVDVLKPLLDGRRNNELMFKQLSFERWLKQQKIQLLHCDAHFVPGDLRKFASSRATYCSGISLIKTT
ncbi:MAG: hypothetical protein ACXVIX_09085 [Halobacteriota archaeon]